MGCIQISDIHTLYALHRTKISLPGFVIKKISVWLGIMFTPFSHSQLRIIQLIDVFVKSFLFTITHLLPLKWLWMNKAFLLAQPDITISSFASVHSVISCSSIYWLYHRTFLAGTGCSFSCLVQLVQQHTHTHTYIYMHYMHYSLTYSIRDDRLYSALYSNPYVYNM